AMADRRRAPDRVQAPRSGKALRDGREGGDRGIEAVHGAPALVERQGHADVEARRGGAEADVAAVAGVHLAVVVETIDRLDVSDQPQAAREPDRCLDAEPARDRRAGAVGTDQPCGPDDPLAARSAETNADHPLPGGDEAD